MRQDKVVLLKKTKPCPMCGRPPDAGFRPFCSKRCADLDLSKWLGEGYRVPGEPVPAGGDGAHEGGGAGDGEDDETP